MGNIIYNVIFFFFFKKKRNNSPNNWVDHDQVNDSSENSILASCIFSLTAARTLSARLPGPHTAKQHQNCQQKIPLETGEIPKAEQELHTIDAQGASASNGSTCWCQHPSKYHIHLRSPCEPLHLGAFHSTIRISLKIGMPRDVDLDLEHASTSIVPPQFL
jgi:hypothetical protein